MSLYGLMENLKYQREVDAAQDKWEAGQAKKRKAVLPEDEIEAKATELFEKVKGCMMKHISTYKKGHSSVPLKTHPKCVIDRVIAKFAEKGIKVKHAYNDGEPTYDHLDINLSTVKVG